MNCFGERDMTAVFLSMNIFINAKTVYSMKSERSARRERTVSASKFRRAMAALSEDLTQDNKVVRLSMSGNTFVIHLDGGTINITINETMKGGEA